jgi:hypothetical protein
MNVINVKKHLADFCKNNEIDIHGMQFPKASINVDNHRCF